MVTDVRTAGPAAPRGGHLVVPAITIIIPQLP